MFKRSIALLALSLLALACTSRSVPMPQPAPDAPSSAVPGGAGQSKVIVVLPDAGPDAVAAAEAAVRAQVHHPDAPAVRLDLIADLLSPTLMGAAPGDPVEPLLSKLGPPEEKLEAVWRWPSLGVELWTGDGRVRRLALRARHRPENPTMKVFVGEVLLGSAALTTKAPDLRIKQIAQALGVGGARGQMDGNVTELAWRRGNGTLFLTFDDDTLLLEAIVLEGFDAQLWNSMKPLEEARQLWDVEPDAVSQARLRDRIEFAQLPAEFKAQDIPRMRLVARHQPHAKRFFDNLETRFLAAGETLRRTASGRAAMLRAAGCEYLVLEQRDDSWDARNPSAVCKFEDEPIGLKKLVAAFDVSPAK